MSKKSLFADLSAFKKKNTLKSVSTKITHRDGRSVIVENLGIDSNKTDDNADDDDIKQNNKNEVIGDDYYKESLPKLQGFNQLPYSYNPSSLKWEVRNDESWHLIEFDHNRLSKLNCSEFSISTISFSKYRSINHEEIDKKLLEWLRKYRPTIIIFINVDIGFFDILLKEKWIQKMYQSTDCEIGRNCKLWNCFCLSSISIKGIMSCLLFKTDKTTKDKYYFIQIFVYLGTKPFMISFFNFDENDKKQTKYQLKQILDFFLKQNQMKDCIFIYIGCDGIMRELNNEKMVNLDLNQQQIELNDINRCSFDTYFEECQYILNKQEIQEKKSKDIDNTDDIDDYKQNTKECNQFHIHWNPISNLLKSDVFRVAGIEYFDLNEIIKNKHQNNNQQSTCDVFANCVYFEQ